jgi:hypothetical protein
MPALSQQLVFTVPNQGGPYRSVSVNYPNTGTTTLTYISEKVKGEGYFNSGDGLHTVSVTTSRYFEGTVKIQATLASEPQEIDWFDVKNTSVTYAQHQVRTTNSVDLFNFTGNFVWVRGHISIDTGSVLSIDYNH